MIRGHKQYLPLVLAAAIVAGAPVAASAQVAATSATVWDPFETINRATYAFNTAFVAVVATPVISAYRNGVPASVQLGIDNVFTNLREPLTAISSAAQGDFNNMGISVGRFAINSVAGIGGVFDVATRMGYVSKADDLGNAMCSYGVPAGPYLMVPFVGPTNAREAAGTVATYGLTYAVTHDYTLPYVIADRVAAAAYDMKLAPPGTEVTVNVPAAPGTATAPAQPVVPTVETSNAPSYEDVRTSYMSWRQDLCTDSVPAANLKPSPLGGVIRIN